MDNKEFKKLWKEQCPSFNSLLYENIFETGIPEADRIIVLGDIHGDWNLLIESLKIAKVIDNKGKWIGKDTIVVQVGDQIDRCRYKAGESCYGIKDDEQSDYKILKYMSELNEQAMKKNGAVYSLIGNHELMNVKGDVRYVSGEGFREFDNYKKPSGDIIEKGEEARPWAFKPGNPVSNFLGCSRQMALIIGSNLFVHAGILEHISKKYKNIKDMNKLLSLYLWNKLENTEEYGDLFTSQDSPLWTRAFGNLGIKHEITEQECDNLLNPLEEVYKVGKIFVGHTPLLKKGISGLCNNKIWLTDYGASNAFNSYDDKYLENTIINNINDDTIKKFRSKNKENKNNLINNKSNYKNRHEKRRPHVLEILNDNEFNILN